MLKLKLQYFGNLMRRADSLEKTLILRKMEGRRKMGKWVIVVQSCPTLCSLVDCSTPGFPVLRHLPKLAQTHVHWVCDAIQPSRPLSSPSPPAFKDPASGSFLMSWLFTSGAQSIGASASASVLSMNIQGWFPLGLAGLILQSKGLLQYHNSKASVLWQLAFFMVLLSHLYMTAGETIVWTI